MNLLLPSPLLANGLEFGWRQSTTEGIVICVILVITVIASLMSQKGKILTVISSVRR